MKEQPTDAGSTPTRRAAAGRRPYVKPSLTEYGSIAKLTQGTATKQSDGKAGGFIMTCL
jgi:hypothetical protein